MVRTTVKDTTVSDIHPTFALTVVSETHQFRFKAAALCAKAVALGKAGPLLGPIWLSVVDD